MQRTLFFKLVSFSQYRKLPQRIRIRLGNYISLSWKQKSNFRNKIDFLEKSQYRKELLARTTTSARAEISYAGNRVPFEHMKVSGKTHRAKKSLNKVWKCIENKPAVRLNWKRIRSHNTETNPKWDPLVSNDFVSTPNILKIKRGTLL